MNEEAYIGVDVSKATLDLAVAPSGEAAQFANDEAGVSEAVGWLKARRPVLVVMESTGGLEIPLYSALGAARVRVAVVNPRQVRDFARATGQLAKTDKLDAAILAQFGAALKPEPRSLPDEAARELEARVSRRQQVVDMITVEKQRLSSTRDKNYPGGDQDPHRLVERAVERDRQGYLGENPR